MKKILLIIMIFNLFLFAEINNITFNVKERDNILLNNSLVNNFNILDDFSTTNLNSTLEIKEIPFYKRFYKKNKYSINDLIKIENKLKEYIESLGYYKNSIKKEFKKNEVIFNINLNERIKVSKILINSKYKDIILLKENDFFSTSKFSKSKNLIKRYFNENGYLNALLESKAFVNIEDYNVEIEFNIQENKQNRINKIYLNNNANISNDLIFNQLDFNENDIIDIRKTESTFSHLYKYGIFDKIKIEPKNIEDINDKKDILISVNEGKNKFLKTILGFNNDEGINIAGNWGNNNFYGNLKKIETGLKLSSINKEIYLKNSIPFFKIPYLGFFNINNKIQFNNNQYDTYNENSLKNDFYIQKDFIIDNKIGILTEKTQIENNINNIEYKKENDDYLINSFYYKGTIDKRDNKIKPKNGYYFSIYLENSLETLYSDIKYNKFITDLRLMKNYKKFTFYYKNRIGMIDNQVPLFKKFYTGGIFTNRGYDYLSIGDKVDNVPIGGISLLENMFEIDYELNKVMDLAIFYDNSLLSNEKFNFGNNNYSAYGLGFRYNTQIGPIRFDIAKPSQSKNNLKFNLSIGLSF